MEGRVAGKVAFITGAARGMGRSHAVRLAEEGADIIAIDVLQDYDSVGYHLATREDLDETVRLVQALDRRIVAGQADVRDRSSLEAVLTAAVQELGRLDIVVANAGIVTFQPWNEVTTQIWQDTIDTNLTGVWNTLTAAAPHLIASGGGSMMAISSAAGLKGQPFLIPYATTKHGVLGITRSLAHELAKHKIRVNTIHPTGVDTPMLAGVGGLEALINSEPDLGSIFVNTFPVENGVLEPRDISHAVLFLGSDEARYITGLAMTVDAGTTIR
jgi:SDR family mycofactocin-dependent oxidoreductase